MLRFAGAGVTDVGLVREHNEDSAFLGPYLALVADGVGGAAAGEVASATTTYVVAAHALAGPEADPTEVLAAGIAAARQELLHGVESDPQRAGMATTLTAVATDGKRVVLGHVGDSRAFVFADHRLVQVSTDHTYVQQLVDEGQLSPGEVRQHPWKNVVLRSLPGSAVGGGDEADLLELELEVGDRLLLCSDGLTDLVDETVIVAALQLQDAQSAAARLVEEALSAGGVDNVTCLVLDVVDGPRVTGDGQLLGAVRDLANIVDPAAVHVAPGAWQPEHLDSRDPDHAEPA